MSNQNQTACHLCDVSNADAGLRATIGDEGECICPSGTILTEYDIFGNIWTEDVTGADGTVSKVKVIKCRKCEENEYSGPAKRPNWECKTCMDPNMEFKETTCVCKDGFKSAGDTCISDAQAKKLSDDGFAEDGFEFKVEYNNVRQVGRSGSTTEAFTSDVFKHYYYQSAIGCREYEDQRMCQILANLCVLNLYNEGTVACKLFQ